MRSSARWTCPPAADRRPRRLGLSLLELLVAIAIVAAIAAVALPWTWSRLSRATLPETADRVVATLLLARAEAMRTGRLVEVVFIPAGDETASDSGLAPDPLGSERDRLRVRHFDPDAFDATAAEILGEGLAADPVGAERDDLPMNGSSSMPVADADAVRGSWTALALPEELRLRPHVGGTRREFAGEGDPEDPSEDPFASLADDSFEPTERVARPMAIFLPDGVNVLAGSWWLEERAPRDRLPPPELDRRRRVRLDLGDAAGMPRKGEVERIVPTTAGIDP